MNVAYNIFKFTTIAVFTIIAMLVVVSIIANQMPVTTVVR